MIVERRGWTHQPHRLMGVDWNNPLAKGLRFLALPTDNTWTDVALGRRAALGSSSGNGSPRAGAFGKSLYYAQANSYPQYLTMPDFKPATSDFWVLVSGTFESAALAVIALSNDAMQDGGANQWRLQPNYDGTSIGGGSFSFLTYGGTFVNAGATSAFVTGQAYTFLGVRRGTTVELWRDGALLASSTGTVQNVSGSETQSIGFGFGATGYSNTAGGHRFLGAGGINTLTTAQAMELSRNPWQLFQPDMVTVFYTTSGTQTYTYTATGGMTFGGSATEERHKVQSVSGGLQFGGSASVSYVGLQTRVVTPSGGITFGGSSTQSITRPESVSGGIQFGGSATVTTHESVRTVTPSGGITFGGSASVSFPSLATLFPYRRFIYGRKGLLDRKISRQ